MKRGLTAWLRNAAVWAWCLGLVLISTDFLSLPFLEWRASAGYVFFGLATFFTLYAEKREFSTRVMLYRLHDVLIFGPWKFLLLYFLWISVFSPFTASPLKSLVYGANGWFSLITVGVMAQFIFCERNMNGITLLFLPLSRAFTLYAITVSLLFVSTLTHLFLPTFPFPILAEQHVNLFLYFSLGFPFVFWDFLKTGRRLLPRWLSGCTLVLGSVTTLLISRKFFQLALIFSVASLLALFVYKRFRFRLRLVLPVIPVFLLALIALIQSFHLNSIWQGELDSTRLKVESIMTNTFSNAIKILVETKGMGMGSGLSPFRGVWARVLAEAGVVGFVLYSLFFLALLKELYDVRHATRVVVSNISFVSVSIFLLFASHFVENPYGAYVWVWYAIWALFSSTHKKKA